LDIANNFNFHLATSERNTSYLNMELSQEGDERETELAALLSIYPEMVCDKMDPYSVSLNLDIHLSDPIQIKVIDEDGNTNNQVNSFISDIPTVKVRIKLPKGYPSDRPPEVRLRSDPDWLSAEKLRSLEQEAIDLWESWGHVEVIFTYLDTLNEQGQDAFGLRDKAAGNAILLSGPKYLEIMSFQAKARKARFNQQTFSCEVCLAPKKGSDCYQMSRCGHVFCKKCIMDYYTSCIVEGDVNKVQCMAFGCFIPTATGKKMYPTIAPAELLQIPLARTIVQRYADMKRKKKMEADKTTVYCPRSWCQAPARSKKYPKLDDISQLTEAEDPDAISQPPAPTKASPAESNEDDRLAICESCSFAFCKRCSASWHGIYKRCKVELPTDEISAEEQASLDFIRKNTSECPTCLTGVQKSSGCNHMTCTSCRTHFCYLCGSWLSKDNPYKHYSVSGTDCYQQLFHLVEGDDGTGGNFAGARRWENEA
jgi:E3 ubiquitin-protein ligase RNF14